MTVEHTQYQSPDDARRARELSLQKSQPPLDLPGYEAQRMIGSGAYGEVWIATARNTGRRVAIKFFAHRSGVDWTLLSREVEKLVYLSADRYVVQLLEVGWNADPPFYVMEFIENGSLDDLLRTEGTLAVRPAVDMFRELAIGLNHAHGKGVLHCDLKPANVLLDQDHRPRLADFGQSRLSHEQLPALGTLFYMAPEQADLTAVPDARWDVYALGAILYRMLTGLPPAKTDEAVKRIEDAKNLTDRLARYRQHLLQSPSPTLHRRVTGVDRALIEIVDRCLMIDPNRRFANVQEILDALALRDQSRARRPLLLLGFVGPVLLLLIMTFTGLRGYDYAVKDSELAVSQRARESNEFAAMFAASSIEDELATYFRVIRREADDPEFLRKFLLVADSPVVAQINDPQLTAEERQRVRESFIDHPIRRELNEFLEQRLQTYLDRLARDPREPKLASMLSLDAQGRMLAVAYDTDVKTQSVGGNYAYRSYFHGGNSDLAETADDATRDIAPITQTHLSAAFSSSTTGIWKVAVSTPVFRNGRDGPVAGVLALTISLGDFAYFRSNNRPDRFAALIDGRDGPNFGVILQHPLFDRLNLDPEAKGDDFSATKYRVTPEQLNLVRTDPRYPFQYRDPLGQAVGGESYRGDWIAAAAPVRLPVESGSSDQMLVLVQERFSDATGPVKKLGSRLKGAGLWALAGILAVIVTLWYVVLRAFEEPHRPSPPLAHRDPRQPTAHTTQSARPDQQPS